jgi:hypothetical protein
MTLAIIKACAVTGQSDWDEFAGGKVENWHQMHWLIPVGKACAGSEAGVA